LPANWICRGDPFDRILLKVEFDGFVKSHVPALVKA
jgi:hypothetical protein